MVIYIFRNGHVPFVILSLEKENGLKLIVTLLVTISPKILIMYILSNNTFTSHYVHNSFFGPLFPFLFKVMQLCCELFSLYGFHLFL